IDLDRAQGSTRSLNPRRKNENYPAPIRCMQGALVRLSGMPAKESERCNQAGRETQTRYKPCIDPPLAQARKEHLPILSTRLIRWRRAAEETAPLQCKDSRSQKRSCRASRILRSMTDADWGRGR